MIKSFPEIASVLLVKSKPLPPHAFDAAFPDPLKLIPLPLSRPDVVRLAF